MLKHLLVASNFVCLVCCVGVDLSTTHQDECQIPSLAGSKKSAWQELMAYQEFVQSSCSPLIVLCH